MNPSVLFLFLVFLFSCTLAPVGGTSVFRSLDEDVLEEGTQPYINEVIAIPNDADTLLNDHRIIVSQFANNDGTNPSVVEVVKRRRRKNRKRRRNRKRRSY
jgi:hypothetical protein